MIIAYDAKRVFRNFTGLGNYCRSTLDMLARYQPQCEQRLLTPALSSDERCARFVSRAVVPHGVVRGSLWRTFCMGAEAKAVGADVFHGLSNELPLRLDIPSVVTVHDVAFRTYTDMYKPWDRAIYDRKWASACRRATRIIAISESTRRDILRFYDVPEERVVVVYQPVQDIFYGTPAPLTFDVPHDYMLYVGSLNSRKNLLAVVQAMEMLPADLRLPLVVVGDGSGDYADKVLAYVASHGMERWFVRRRVDDNAQLQALYAHARLFVYPSHYEGMGLPVIEAQLSGCPVITSNVSSLPEAGGDAALQVLPTDVRALADAMEQLITDDTLVTRLSSEGRTRSHQRFAPERLAKELTDVYSEIAL